MQKLVLPTYFRLPIDILYTFNDKLNQFHNFREINKKKPWTTSKQKTNCQKQKNISKSDLKMESNQNTLTVRKVQTRGSRSNISSKDIRGCVSKHT